jgi:hypothetical protein
MFLVSTHLQYPELELLDETCQVCMCVEEMMTMMMMILPHTRTHINMQTNLLKLTQRGTHLLSMETGGRWCITCIGIVVRIA